jgi:hypothetical protein
MIDNAHKTAITRTKLSAPAKWLLDNGCLKGRGLDYGCGRGGDADRLDYEGYDPHYQPVVPFGVFDTVVCTFVMNVIESHSARRAVLSDIDSLLADDGCAYITVRTDKRELTGRKANHTWQSLIVLDLPVVRRGSGYITYRLCKGDFGCAMHVEVF